MTDRVLPKLVVFETPGLGELSSTLAEIFPGTEIDLRPDPALGRHEPSLDALSVWHIPWKEPELLEKAPQLLGDLVFPLAARRGPFVVSFEVGRDTFAPKGVTTDEMQELDLEDVIKLLGSDSAGLQNFDQLKLLDSQTPQTPIEDALAAAFQSQGIEARPQVRLGRFVVDFLVDRGGRKWAIEADGLAYHDAERDAERDRALASLGVESVIRFTGSEINRDATACARQVLEITSSVKAVRRSGVREQALDESQEMAAHHSSGTARVLAPAGSGKTRVLVERIAELVREGVDPSSILALAFNKKANDQLVARLEGLEVPTSAKSLFDESKSGVRCATFHAFGFRLQREYLGLDLELEESPFRWRSLMEQAAQESGVSLEGTKRGSDPIGELLKARERAAADLVNPNEIEVEFETFDGEPPRIVSYGAVDREFESMRVDHQIQSFSDLLTTSVQQLLRSTEARDFIQRYFTHVLVDEYQDLNAAQLALVDIVSRPSRDLFIVGDDDQLIYGWRFARLTNILDFGERVPSSETYVLSTNYRSSSAVVESSRRVIDHNKNRISKDIQPRDGAPDGEVRYVGEQSMSKRSKEVIDFIEAAKDRTGKWREIAVLCRYKAQQPHVAMALDRAGIPRSPLLSYRLFSDSSMTLLRNYCELVRRPEHLTGEGMASIINRPNRFGTNKLRDKLRDSSSPWRDFRQFLRGSKSGDEFRTRALQGFLERAEILQRKYSENLSDSQAFLDQVVDSFDLERFWTDESAKSARDKDEASPVDLLGLIRLYASEASDVDSFLATWDGRASEEEEKSGTARDDLVREDMPDRDSVVISTMHSSKGREYESVVIFDYAPDLEKLTDQEIEEERRVFYVGMTRARDSLLITADSSRPLHRFVRESIAPASPGERLEIDERQTSLDVQRRQATINLERARDALVKVEDGREMERLRRELSKARKEEARLREEANDLGALLDRAGLWQRISGQKSKLEQQLAECQRLLTGARLVSLQFDDEIIYLQADASRYKEPHVRDVDLANRSLSDLDQKVRVLADRINQLKLIGS